MGLSIASKDVRRWQAQQQVAEKDVGAKVIKLL